VKIYSKGLSAENRALEARMAMLSDEELIEIAEGRATI
jgi:cell division protein FtsB